MPYLKPERPEKVSAPSLRASKERGEKLVCLTAYDYPTARILDAAGIPVLLVGDSLGQTVLGYETTLPVTMEEMLHHTKAVSRGAKEALIVGDMPFLSYQASVEQGIANAGRFLKEAGAHAVKVEGAQTTLTEALTELGIPVMGHLGLTPQSVRGMGGYRVQGRSDEDAVSPLAALPLHGLAIPRAIAVAMQTSATTARPRTIRRPRTSPSNRAPRTPSCARETCTCPRTETGARGCLAAPGPG